MIKTLRSRPHEVQSLADMGIKQYQYTFNKVTGSSRKKTEVGTSLKAELTDKEYT